MNNQSLQNQQSDKNNQKKQVVRPHNWVEAIKDMGRDVKTQAKAATVGVMENTLQQVTGQQTADNQPAQPSQPNRVPLNPQLLEMLRQREAKIRQHESVLYQQQRSSETLIFHRKEAQAKKEIELVQAELKKLIVETKDAAVELWEAEQTVSTRVIQAGVYHFTFFARVRRLIRLARKRISESKTWLQTFNSRQKAKSFYWGQVKSSGTKYMMSNERTLATSAG